MTEPVQLRSPYLLFLGDAPGNLDAKTATGVAHWRPDLCLGQLRMAGCGADCGLSDMTVAEALEGGARTLVIGVAPMGGSLPESWKAHCIEALEAGMDLANGLHSRLGADPDIAAAAARGGGRVLDVRDPPNDLPCGDGRPRAGKRLLTVGTDCCVGKMFAALALEKEMRARGLKATFRATGQTGIFIAGTGIAVDAVISDFLSGAVEVLAPANQADHWDVIEGQGSLFHPSYAGVSLGLLHGAQPDAIVVCHEAGRSQIDGDYPAQSLASMERIIATNLDLARLTNPAVRLVGLAINTSRMPQDDVGNHLAALTERHGVPAVDPVRTGVAAIVEGLA
jgi:uncharacterized NAD-dependent epimerase/dehydratase family protein